VLALPPPTTNQTSLGALRASYCTVRPLISRAAGDLHSSRLPSRQNQLSRNARTSLSCTICTKYMVGCFLVNIIETVYLILTAKVFSEVRSRLGPYGLFINQVRQTFCTFLDRRGRVVQTLQSTSGRHSLCAANIGVRRANAGMLRKTGIPMSRSIHSDKSCRTVSSLMGSVVRHLPPRLLVFIAGARGCYQERRQML